MELTAVYIAEDTASDKPNQYLFEETQITVTESAFPDVTELFTKLEEVALSPPWVAFRRESSSIFWRFSEEKFLPIVDFLSYKCFLSLHADGRLYVLSPHTTTFPPACLQAWMQRGMSRDSLDSNVMPPEPCGDILASGTSRAFTQNVRLVGHLLKGVPAPPPPPPEPEAKGKKSKDTKGKKGKASANDKKGKKGGDKKGKGKGKK